MIETARKDASATDRDAALAAPAEVLHRILEALRGLRFGAIEVQVHDSHVVRITRTEKFVIEGSTSKGHKPTPR